MTKPGSLFNAKRREPSRFGHGHVKCGVPPLDVAWQPGCACRAKESRKNHLCIFIRAARVIKRNNRSVTAAALTYQTTYFGVSPKHLGNDGFRERVVVIDPVDRKYFLVRLVTAVGFSGGGVRMP